MNVYILLLKLSMEKDIKDVSDISRNLLNSLLDLPTQNFNSSELKLLTKCKLNALELFKDILLILSKIESRKLRLKGVNK